LELHTVDPSSKEKIYKVKDGKSVVLDFKLSSAPDAEFVSRHAHTMLSSWQALGIQISGKGTIKGAA